MTSLAISEILLYLLYIRIRLIGVIIRDMMDFTKIVIQNTGTRLVYIMNLYFMRIEIIDIYPFILLLIILQACISQIYIRI